MRGVRAGKRGENKVIKRILFSSISIASTGKRKRGKKSHRRPVGGGEVGMGMVVRPVMVAYSYEKGKFEGRKDQKSWGEYS